MTVADAIAQILKAEGVEYLFAYPINHIIEAAAKVGIRPIIVRQERTGLHMADAFSRTTSGRRIGVLEDAVDTDPSWLEGNLFVALSQPPYVNDDGSGPSTEEDLNDPRFTTGNANVGENLLVEGVSTSSLFVDPTRQDFHLQGLLPGGAPNPAVDAGGTYLGKQEYGGVRDDIDGERRPTSGAALDLGADELNV